MFGEPKDVDGECNAILFISDNYGDNSATIRCQLAPNHEGLHQEQFNREGGMVTITWVVDERKKCDHGCGQWKHAHDSETIACPKDADEHEFSDCAYCHPNKESKECEKCGKTYYYEGGHKRHCPGQWRDSTGRLIGVGDRVNFRGQIYTIKSFGDPIGRFGTRAITFEEPLHVQDEVPDEIGVDLVEARP